MNYLITGYHGEPHVSAENQRGLNAGLSGPGRYILPVGQALRAELSAANTIRIFDGKLLDNGACAGIPAGQYIDLTIPAGSQGMKRNDLVIFRYSKDTSTRIETGEFVIKSGTPAASAPADPALTQADLLAGDALIDEMPLYRVQLSGVTVGTPALTATRLSPLRSYEDGTADAHLSQLTVSGQSSIPMKLQCGIASVTTKSGTTVTKAITFDKPFLSGVVPAISLLPASLLPNEIHLSVSGVSRLGFTIQCLHDSLSQAHSIHWIAVAP